MQPELVLAGLAGLGGMMGWGLADFFAKKTIDEIGDVVSLVWAHVHSQVNYCVDPNTLSFEIVERKFRGHPDTLADLVAQTFCKKYIESTWKKFPKLANKYFPNFSVDKYFTHYEGYLSSHDCSRADATDLQTTADKVRIQK